MNALDRIRQLARASPADVLATVDDLPVHAFRFGSGDAALLVTGGVHGLERIGTEVAIAFLSSLVERVRWDSVLQHALARCRVIVVPLVNPVGMSRNQRANGNGVDLMRNAPAAPTGGTPLLGGQRISRHLPWFMGTAIEPEAKAIIDLVEAELLPAPYSIALDLHSGYGLDDRLWYPYARTREPPPDLPAFEALFARLDADHPYRIEQTAQAYTIRGDLWDYLYDRPRRGTFLPLTLEMGAYTLLRGRRRTLRRHLPMIERLLHAVASHG